MDEWTYKELRALAAFVQKLEDRVNRLELELRAAQNSETSEVTTK